MVKYSSLGASHDASPADEVERERRHSEIRQLARPAHDESLEHPTDRYHIDGVDYDVYIVKRVGEVWPTNGVGQMALMCRQTRGDFYGDDTPVTDEIDDQCNVFLTRARYYSADLQEYVTEWISNRLGPHGATPTGIDELTFYDVKSDPPTRVEDALIRAGYVRDQREVDASVFTSSAYCAQPARSDGGTLLRRHRGASVAGSLMTKTMLAVDDAEQRQCKLILFQMPPALASTMVTPIQRVDEACGLPPGGIGLRRHSSKPEKLRYRHPGYFLDIAACTALLRDLLAARTLDACHVAGLLPTERSLEAFLGKPRVTDYVRMGELFSHEGTLPGGELTGAELRALADARVGDGPALWMHPHPELLRHVAGFEQYRRNTTRRRRLDQVI